MLSLILGNILHLLQAVDAVTPLNEEVKLLFYLVLDCSDNECPHFPGVVRNLRFKLAGVLIDTLDRWCIKLNIEIV